MSSFGTEVSALIITAIIFVVAFLWQDTLVTLFNTFFPQEENNILAKVIFAVIVTIIAVAIVIYLGNRYNFKNSIIRS